MKENGTRRTGKKVPLLCAFGIVAASLTLASCDNGTAPQLQQAHVQVQLTDAPSDMLSSAEIWVSRVYLQGYAADSVEADGMEADSAEADSMEEVDLFNDPSNPKHFDLLTLQDSVTAELTNVVDVDPGAYAQVRIVVDSARVTLAPGYVFADSTTTAVLQVPSGEDSGIKVSLNGALVTTSDSTTTVVVDFPVDRNFVIQMNQDGTIRAVLFSPLLTERERDRS